MRGYPKPDKERIKEALENTDGRGKKTKIPHYLMTEDNEPNTLALSCLLAINNMEDEELIIELSSENTTIYNCLEIIPAREEQLNLANLPDF